MPNFLARVLLHEGEKSYPALHKAMSGKGFETYFPQSKMLKDLPQGTYFGRRQETLAAAINDVVAAATSIGFPPDSSTQGQGIPNTSEIVVVEFSGIREKGLKRRPAPAAIATRTK